MTRTPKLTRSTAHKLPDVRVMSLVLAFWRLCRRREAQMQLELKGGGR